MLNNKQSKNSHGARKIIGILSVFLLPAVTFAQNYGPRMMSYGNRDYIYNSFVSGHSMLGLMSFLFVIPVLGVIIAIALFIFWVKMLIDAIKHSPESTKIVWVLVIIFAHIVGAFIYYFVEYRKKHKAKEHTEHKKEEGK